METETTGHSVNLLNNQLILSTTNIGDDNKGKFRSLENPRAGLRGNIWTSTKIDNQLAPKNHVTFVSGNSLFFFGGDSKTQSELGNDGKWTILQFTVRTLTSNNPFDKFTSYACSVKIGDNKFLVLGGTHTKENGEESVLSDVFEVNTAEKTVEKVGEMNRGRTQHTCAVISKSSFDQNGIKSYSRAILISGGVSTTDDKDSIVTEVELFVYDSKESLDLENSMVEPRFKHSMVQLGGEIFALGGETKVGTTQSTEKFIFDEEASFEGLKSSGAWETSSTLR